MMRLFIATPINAEVQQELARIISALKNTGGPVNWVAPPNIHLTLKFLGDTNEKLIPEINDIINYAASTHYAVPTTLNSLGAFPSLSQPRVYWVDLKGGDSYLGEIAKTLDDAVHALGFEKESRPFKSHLTLGRVKFPQNVDKLSEVIKTIKVNSIRQVFDRIILFKSTLTPRGSIYENLYEAKLKLQN